MLILIDGYNLIRQSDSLRRYERKSLEAGRKTLIARLVEYGNKRNHQITVVFDGVQNGWADEGRDREGKIHIFYSRHGEKADDVIKRIASQTDGEVVVVSSDREISSFAIQMGKTSLPSPEFETIMRKVISSAPEQIRPRQEENVRERQTKKKGQPRRLPKAKRQAQIKIKKL